MVALPRPDLMSGPQRELNDALHALHHRAGWPSLRNLGRDAGCSHTTVSHVFSSPRLPPWGVLELLVEAMGGDTAEFHQLWLASSEPAEPTWTPSARIAGRRDELVAVRRHLDSGTGLLLVTGEAGLGKTALVTAAAAGAEAFVASGVCRPLSTEVPLLPVAEMLRQVCREHAAWFEEALGAAPLYVAGAVAQMLPELAGEEAPQVSDEWARQRLFHALGALLSALRDQRPLALFVEDAHWADATTLDLLELLSTQRCPLVVTVRTEDPDVGEAFTDWLTRARLLPGAATLALVPLTLAETAQQLALLREREVEPDEVARIQARSLGQPLFTEQLALHPDDQPLPELLADLLLHRLRGLSPTGWAVGRALGVCDQPLPVDQVAQIAGLEPLPGLRELDAQRLLAPADGPVVRLRHPLIADAIRQRLVPGEAPEVHRRVATVLAAAPDPPAAEIAEHWAAAGDTTEELRWRIAAARAASASFAVEAAATQWRRVLDLWPDELDEAGAPPLGRAEMYVAVLDAGRQLDIAAVVPLTSKALEVAEDAAPEQAAAIWHRVGHIRSWLGESDAALELSARAVAVYADLPPSHDHVEALTDRRSALEHVGRFREAAEFEARAVTVARALGVPSVLKKALAQRAWNQWIGGDPAGAEAAMKELATIVLDPPDPYCEMVVAMKVTDMLLLAGAPAAEVAEAARTALTAADTWGLHQGVDAAVRSNVAEAFINQGDPAAAWELVAPHTTRDPVQERWWLHLQRAVLELYAGRADEAQRQLAAVAAGPIRQMPHRLDLATTTAGILLWTGQPSPALHWALPVLEAGEETDEPVMLAPLLVLAARAAADLGDRARGEELRDLHRRLTADPFAPHPPLVTPAAQGATWTAELARLQGSETVDGWVAAATAWDRLTRPYDSGYCRWRGAQVALATGQGTLAGRLLKRAAVDARGHLPLTEAIRSVAVARS